jgi:Zn-dependent peptidase ImmA (M78 family)
LLADRFSVSREVLLRRLLIVGKTTEEFYESKRRQYLAHYASMRERTSRGGPPVHRLAVRNNGRRFTRLVLDAYELEKISPADVVDYLGTSLSHLENIDREVRANTPSIEAE